MKPFLVAVETFEPGLVVTHRHLASDIEFLRFTFQNFGFSALLAAPESYASCWTRLKVASTTTFVTSFSDFEVKFSNRASATGPQNC